MKQLTMDEIKKLASRKNVKGVAVENFLMTLDEGIGFSGNNYNAITDSKSYKWNAPTLKAIQDGIKKAFGK